MRPRGPGWRGIEATRAGSSATANVRSIVPVIDENQIGLEAPPSGQHFRAIHR